MIEILPNWHPIFVHFTVALLCVAALLHLASHFVSDARLAEQWTTVARWNLWFGVITTVLTIAAGMYAYYTVDHDAPSHAAMKIHRNWAFASSLVFLVAAAWVWKLSRSGQAKSWALTGLLLVATGLLLSTAWHGGELVYRHGLGVKALPKVTGPGHSHVHEDGSTHDHGGGTPEGTPADHGHQDDLGGGDMKTEDHPHPAGSAPHDH